MKKTLLVLAMAMMVTACNDHQPTQVVQPAPQVVQQAPVAAAPAPVIINQAPAQDHSMSSALTGAAVGYMLGSAGRRDTVVHHYEPAPVVSRPAPTQNITVNKTVIVNQAVKETPKAAPAPVVAPVVPKSVPVPASKVVPQAPSPVSTTTASRLSLAKPSTTTSSSFGGFNSSSRRK